VCFLVLLLLLLLLSSSSSSSSSVVICYVKVLLSSKVEWFLLLGVDAGRVERTARVAAAAAAAAAAGVGVLVVVSTPWIRSMLALKLLACLSLRQMTAVSHRNPRASC
jgi:hypothetical protein